MKDNWVWQEQEVEYWDVVFTYKDTGEVEVEEAFQREKQAYDYAKELNDREAKYPDEISGYWSVVYREELEEVLVEDINEWW